jgi:competence protein ComGC
MILFAFHRSIPLFIEMMIVLMIISILLMIAVPSMTKSNEVVKKKSCEATVKLVQSQVAAYNSEETAPLVDDLTPLITNGYVDTVQCPDGTNLILNNGEVSSGGS